MKKKIEKNALGRVAQLGGFRLLDLEQHPKGGHLVMGGVHLGKLYQRDAQGPDVGLGWGGV